MRIPAAVRDSRILLALKRYLTTEFAVTSRRVIVKEGFIRRSTPSELNHNRVEGLAVDQGVFARIFNAGTIWVVMGTGGTKQPNARVSSSRPNGVPAQRPGSHRRESIAADPSKTGSPFRPARWRSWPSSARWPS